MKTFLSILLLVSVLFASVSCYHSSTDNPGSESNTKDDLNAAAETTDEPTGSITTAPILDNGPKHYEIDLTLENFGMYLSYSAANASRGNYVFYNHNISGVLSYAYYVNVIVTIAVNGKEYKIPLNAAGNGLCSTSDRMEGEIVGVVGTVIFNV